MNRVEAHEKYGELLFEAKKRKQESAVLRLLCKRDLFFLLVRMCGRADLDDDWHFDRIKEVEAAPDGFLDLWAREHGKSSIAGGLIIQDILKNPEERIVIFSHTRPIAKDHMVPIKLELQENLKLKKLFPDILYGKPERDSQKWSEDDGICVKRQGKYPEMTLEAHGLVDSLPVGMHYTIIDWDDVITEKFVTSPEMIEKTMNAINASSNLKTRGARFRGQGTFYHYNDPYVQMLERGILKGRIYPATADGTATGEPVLFTREELAERRKHNSPYQFACQYLLSPKTESRYGLEDKYLQFWSTINPNCWRGMNILIFVDPANEKKKGSDYTVFTVIGLGADLKKYVIRWVRDRLNLEERTTMLFSLHREFNKRNSVKGVYYEHYGMQADIQHIKSVMNQENYRFTIKEVGGNVPKNDRINTLVPQFQSGEIYLPEECNYITTEGKRVDLTKVFINEEYRLWPFAPHDDMLDDLARINSPEVHLPFPDRSVANVNYQPEQNYNVFHTEKGFDPIAYHLGKEVRA